jgi:prevent-host-death family protein
MTRITTSEARRRFAELVTHARHRGARVVLTHYGKPVAALVPFTDLTFLAEAAPPEVSDAQPIAIRNAADALVAARKVLGPTAVVSEAGEKLIGLRDTSAKAPAHLEALAPSELRGRGVSWTAAFANIGVPVVEMDSLVTYEGDTWRVVAIAEGGQLVLTNGRLNRTVLVSQVRPFQPAR